MAGGKEKLKRAEVVQIRVFVDRHSILDISVLNSEFVTRQVTRLITFVFRLKDETIQRANKNQNANIE